MPFHQTKPRLTSNKCTKPEFTYVCCKWFQGLSGQIFTVDLLQEYIENVKFQHDEIVGFFENV